MTQPAHYKGSATFAPPIGAAPLDSFRQLLDPRKWAERYPGMWRKSIFVNLLEPNTDNDPVEDPGRANGDIFAKPGLTIFYEDVLFSALEYRNVLEVTVRPVVPSSIGYDYNQYQTLSTTPDDDPEQQFLGGIDVDNGFSMAEVDPKTGDVTVTIEKCVRFTQPENSANDLNALANVLVPLLLDTWLHTLIFV